MLDCRQDLGEDKLALQIRQTPPGADTGEELPPSGVLHHQVESLQRLHHLVQADYVGVGELRHAGDFGVEEVWRALIEARLIQDFHGYPLWQMKTGGGGQTVFSLLFYVVFYCQLVMRGCFCLSSRIGSLKMQIRHSLFSR